MTEEIRLEGLGVAPGVLETIATVAAQSVEGVASVIGTQGIVGLVQKGTGKGGAIVSVSENGDLAAQLHVAVSYGRPLRDVATDVQQAVADALLTQTSQSVSAVDVFIDDIVFPGQ